MNDFVVWPKSVSPGASGQQPTAASCGPAMTSAPTHADIARRAYDIYVKTGCQPDQCQRNWQRAVLSLQDEVPPTFVARESNYGARD